MRILCRTFGHKMPTAPIELSYEQAHALLECPRCKERMTLPAQGKSFAVWDQVYFKNLVRASRDLNRAEEKAHGGN